MAILLGLYILTSMRALTALFLFILIGVPCIGGGSDATYAAMCVNNRMFGAPGAWWPWLLWLFIALFYLWPAIQTLRFEWFYRHYQ